MTWNGVPAWCKRPETLSLRYRLQKGDPQKSFQTELQTYKMLAARGLPGPEVLSAHSNYIVFKHAGVTLRAILKDKTTPQSCADDALTAAARALAQLHSRGVAHGRPAPRDICLDNRGKVTFLDWEFYAQRRNTPRGFARDFIVFTFFATACAGGTPTGMAAATRTYLAIAPDPVADQILKTVSRLEILQSILSPVLRRFSHKPDIAAIQPTLAFLKDQAQRFTDDRKPSG